VSISSFLLLAAVGCDRPFLSFFHLPPFPTCDDAAANRPATGTTDTGERPYECLCCRACFARSDVLKRHYEKCTERTPGWRDVAPEDRLDHLHGRRGRPKKSMPNAGKKGAPGVLPGDPAANGSGRGKRRRAGSVGTSGQSSEQNSRRNSRDELAAAAALRHAVAESEEFNKQSIALAGDDLSS